jgi:hypothetical protein
VNKNWFAFIGQSKPGGLDLSRRDLDKVSTVSITLKSRFLSRSRSRLLISTFKKAYLNRFQKLVLTDREILILIGLGQSINTYFDIEK